MRNPAPSSLVFAASVLLVSTLFVATGRTHPAERPSSLPVVQTAADEAGATLLVSLCNKCHDSARIVEKRRTKADWQDTIVKMMEKGAAGESQEFETLFAYLCRRHGEVYINAATSDEIVSILSLSSKDADAIVAYRTAKGAFQNFDAITKVPGIDVKALEAHKDAVVF